jgi:hypothetical protein
VADKEALKKAIDDVFAATNREIDGLKDEADAIGRSVYENERLKKEKELLAKLDEDHRHKGGAITADERDEAEKLADAYGRAAQALADYKRHLEDVKSVADSVFGDMQSALDEFIDTGKLNFKSLIESIVKDLAKLAVHNLLGTLENGTSGTGNSGLVGLIGKALFGPAAAAGSAFAGNGIGSAGMFGSLTAAGPTAPVEGVAGRALGAYAGYTDLINSAALKNRLDPDLLAALIHRESGFNANAQGPATRFGRAQGLTQLLPGTAKDLGVTNPFDPTQNINGGASYLRGLMDKYGSRDEALAAYNWGPGNVDRMVGKNGAFDLSKTPLETQKYVTAINAQAAQYAKAIGTTAQTAQSSASSFSGVFPQALSSVISAVSGGGGGGLLSLFTSGFGAVSGGLNGGGRAAGGPVLPGMSYDVGEHGPERLVMGRSGGIVIPRAVGGRSRGPAGADGFAVHVVPSPYFDVHVERISGAGDRRTLDTARRGAPAHMARFQALGTT